MENIKKNHHYVPQFYLEAWVQPDLYMLKGNKIEKRNTKSIASEKYFYRLEEISENDILYIEKVTSSMSETSKKFNKPWLNIYSLISEGTKQIIDTPNKTLEVERLVKVIRTNTDENVFSSIEDAFKKSIEHMLIEKDIEFDNDTLASFTFCLAIQYVRTRRIKDGFFRAFFDSLQPFIDQFDEKNVDYYKSLNLNSIWTVLSKYYATNTGMYIYTNINKSDSLFLLHNNTKEPFITGDQPALNLQSSGNYKFDEPPHEFDLYYPISPELAVLFCLKGSKQYVNDTLDLSESEVKFFNDKIFDHSFEQVYSNERSMLEKYIKN